MKCAWLIFLFLAVIFLSGCVKEPAKLSDNYTNTNYVNGTVQNNTNQLPTGCAYDNPSCSGGQKCKDDQCIVVNCTQTRTFNMLVFIDDNSYQVSDNEIYAYFEQASSMLFNRTCTDIKVTEIWHVSVQKNEDIGNITGNLLKENTELTNNANGFVFFSHLPDCAKNNGGCAWSIEPSFYGVPNYCNTFSHKGQTNFIYGSLIDWNHKFGACGYDSDGNHVSDSSIDGECRNQQGITCVLQNGYYMCDNLVSDYYASNNQIFTITTIVHEIMHHFGDNGVMDHFGTTTCQAGGSYSKDFYCPTNDDFGCYFGMCPYTYKNFENSKNIC